MAKKVYRVKKGDDFFKISRKLYGDVSYAMDLIRANPGFDYVGPGMVLRLPKLDPRVKRQRKIKRREKLYGKPEPPKEQATTQVESDAEKYERILGLMEDPEEIMGYDYGADLGQDEGVGVGQSAPTVQQPQTLQEPVEWWNDPAKHDELIDLMAETLQSMGLEESAMMEEFGMGEVKEEPEVQPAPPPDPPPQMAGDEADDPAEPDQSGTQYPEPETPPQPDGDEEGSDDTSADVSDSPAGDTEGKAKEEKDEDKATISAISSTTPELTDVQEVELRTKLADMGLDVPATLYDFGLSDRDPHAVDILDTNSTSFDEIKDDGEGDAKSEDDDQVRRAPKVLARLAQQPDIPQIPSNTYCRRELQIWFDKQMSNPGLKPRQKEILVKMYLEKRSELPLENPNEMAILFSGGNGLELDSPGPIAQGQTYAWLQDIYGAPIPSEQWVQYPGVEYIVLPNGERIKKEPYGKHHQAQMGTQIDTGYKDLNLVGYSAGADSCLMYAHDQLQKGKKVKTMILLDPSMTGAAVDGRKLDGSYNGSLLWQTMLDDLIKSGTDVVIVDDGENEKIGPAKFYEAPTGESSDGVKYGNFHHEPHSSARPHWDQGGERFGIGTNNNWGFMFEMIKKFWNWKAEKLDEQS